MNSDKNEAEKLPDGWILCKSKSNPGRKYYFNKKTGKSSWTQPQVDDEKPEPNKQKNKKEKTNPEKSQKEEEKNNLKRKSDSTEDSFPKKKQKQDPPIQEKTYRVVKRKVESSPAQRHCDTDASSISVPEVDVPDSSRKESPAKCLNSSRRYSPPNPTPTKNLANTRLSQLRARLSSEAQPNKPDEEKSPIKSTKHKISPQTPQCDIKHPRLDLKSPNFSESKCTTTQSPSSDSFQSIPSPSQFFAANKIISSMKAQLPEKYCNKSKPKDTFAEIEEGICNQTAEYPFMKHPATPPQFSEASKLMSAIKSKLSYKVSPKDTNVKHYTSASARMESLRARLSNEGSDTKNVIENNFLGRRDVPKYSEAMDVEDYKMDVEVCKTNPNKTSVYYSNTKNNFGPNGSKENIVLVVDTNIFIHELDVIRNVLNSHIKGYSEQPTLLVPWRVVNELDRLKDNNNGNGAICKRARAAMDYLYKSLPENDRIKGQSLRDANSHIYPCELPDDEILNCCLQQSERGKSVILLSNDKNLCNKAQVNGVKCLALAQLKPLLENKPQPAADPDLCASVKHYENTMYHLLANILENEMRAKYNNLWQHVIFKAPPWSLTDVLQCLLKHWVAVFNEVFPRIEHLVTDLRNTLVSIENKDPKSLSQSEMSNFKDLCLEIARKCQIIPEYMELAKATVERLLRRCANGTTDERGEMVVIDAFEGLWTVFSSYCAKLSSALGISHSIEDKLPGDEPLPALTGKWPMFRNQINALAVAMKGALSCERTERCAEERVRRLAAVFRESLLLTRMDHAAVHDHNVSEFCTSCRNMLHEACSKFSELTELLNVCENNMGNI